MIVGRSVEVLVGSGLSAGRAGASLALQGQAQAEHWQPQVASDEEADAMVARVGGTLLSLCAAAPGSVWRRTSRMARMC